MVRYSIIEDRYWASIDKYRIIDTITKEDVLTLHKQLLKHVFVETLVVGNFTQKVIFYISPQSMFKVCLGLKKKNDNEKKFLQPRSQSR